MSITTNIEPEWLPEVAEKFFSIKVASHPPSFCLELTVDVYVTIFFDFYGNYGDVVMFIFNS